MVRLVFLWFFFFFSRNQTHVLSTDQSSRTPTPQAMSTSTRWSLSQMPSCRSTNTRRSSTSCPSSVTWTTTSCYGDWRACTVCGPRCRGREVTTTGGKSWWRRASSSPSELWSSTTRARDVTRWVNTLQLVFFLLLQTCPHGGNVPLSV